MANTDRSDSGPTGPSWKAWARPVALVLSVGAFLSVLGPFGTHDLGWPGVWIYWTGFMALGAVFGYGAGHLTPRLAPGAPEWLVYLVAAATVSAPMTAAVALVNTWLAGDPLDWRGVPLTYALVFVISAFATAVVYVVDRLRAPPPAGGTDSPGRTLLDKLPPRLRTSPLIAFTAEDHYLRVHAEAGEALVLMRFSDALTAVAGLDGAQTHRSWWVARNAVASVSRGDGRAVLTLRNGIEAPVSRTYSRTLREAGWY